MKDSSKPLFCHYFLSVGSIKAAAERVGWSLQKALDFLADPECETILKEQADKQKIIGKRDSVIRKMAEIAFGDAVSVLRLVFETPETETAWSQVDVSQVAGLKRHANGTVEIELVDRLAALRQLIEVLRTDEKEASLPLVLKALQDCARQEADRMPDD